MSYWTRSEERGLELARERVVGKLNELAQEFHYLVVLRFDLECVLEGLEKAKGAIPAQTLEGDVDLQTDIDFALIRLRAILRD